MKPYGTFKVTGGKLVVTDPCYDVGGRGQGVLKNVRNGEWNAFVETEDFGRELLGGTRVTKLRAELATDQAGGPWVIENISIGVDSGQAGIFSMNKYPAGERAEDGKWNKDKFYDLCCEATIKGKAGIIDGIGIVSQSGWGDGVYACRTRRDSDKKIIAVEIVFIDEDEADSICTECGEPNEELHDGVCNECGLVSCEKCGDMLHPDELNREGFCNSCQSEVEE